MFSNNHAKFHAFITKVNNSALFCSLAASSQIQTCLWKFCIREKFESDKTSHLNSFRKELAPELVASYGFQMHCH